MLGTWRRPRFDVSQGGYNTSTMPARLSRHRRTRISYPWTPRSIPGLVFWVAADKIEGKNDGDALTTWSDLSFNRLDFAKNGSTTITYETNEINGLPCVWFHGDADGSMLSPATSDGDNIKQDFSLFAVYNLIAEYGPSEVFHKGDGATAAGSKWGFISEWNGDGQGQVAYYVGSSAATVYWTPQFDVWAMGNAVRMGDKLTARYVDSSGMQVPTAATLSGDTNAVSYKMSIGGLTTGIFPPNEKVAEVFMYDHALTHAERFAAETYLRRKYAFTAGAGS